MLAALGSFSCFRGLAGEHERKNTQKINLQASESGSNGFEIRACRSVNVLIRPSVMAQELTAKENSTFVLQQNVHVVIPTPHLWKPVIFLCSSIYLLLQQASKHDPELR